MASSTDNDAQMTRAMDTYHAFNKLMFRGAIGVAIIAAIVVFLISH
ncbi:MAG: hypothetical protein KGQ42_01420 [Alphaproteobacteria bacterium]|nr:hypothetical protein [Alphaproteobacteria bacterium]MDE2339741.1 hypothetical protein [Alphaproteobacteria bacterium]